MQSTSSVLGKNIFHLCKPGDYPAVDVTVAKPPRLKQRCCHSLCRQDIRPLVTDVLDLSVRVTEGYLSVELETSLIVFFIYKLFQNKHHIGLWRVQWTWRPPLLTPGPSSFMTKILTLRISDLLKLFGNLGTLTLLRWAFHFWFSHQVRDCVYQTFLLDHFGRLVDRVLYTWSRAVREERREGCREEATMLVLPVTTEVLLLQILMMVRGMVTSPSLQMVECTPSDQVSFA